MQSVALRRLATATSLPRSYLSPWHTPVTHKLFHSTPPTPASPFRLTSKPSNTTNTTPANEVEHTSPDDNGLDMDIGRYAPYKPKRQWPPDMTKLSSKHQFRLERKYRRRAALKFARPTWMKGTKLAQWGVIFFTLIYAVLFMEWDEGRSPFDEFREMIFTGAKGAFSAPAPVKKVEKE